jgi:hypothetical protein
MATQVKDRDKYIVDLNDMQLQAECITVNPAMNAFDNPPPPPDDRRYEVAVTMDEGKAVEFIKEYRRGDEDGKPTGQIYMNFPLILRVNDPNTDWDGQVLFETATSYIRNQTSRLHTILRGLQAPALQSMSPFRLKQHAIDVFTTEPRGYIEGEWLAQVEDPEYKKNRGWRPILKGMRNFPQDKSMPSGYYHIIDDPKGLGRVAAKFNITRWLLPEELTQ